MEREIKDCSNYKKDLFGETDMKKVAEAIGDLHYETLSQLLWELSKKLRRDASADRSKNRFKLFKALREAQEPIEIASFKIQEAFEISKPFMTQQP